MIINRITAGFFLILILLVLSVYYHNHYESHQEYPSTGVILSSYPEGSTVSVSGTALRQNKNGFDFLDIYKGKYVEYKIETSQQVKPGDHIQLIGVLDPSYTIKATKIIIETDWSYEFVIFRSALAAIFLIFIFLRYWKFNFKTLELTRRK